MGASSGDLEIGFLAHDRVSGYILSSTVSSYCIKVVWVGMTLPETQTCLCALCWAAWQMQAHRKQGGEMGEKLASYPLVLQHVPGSWAQQPS